MLVLNTKRRGNLRTLPCFESGLRLASNQRCYDVESIRCKCRQGRVRILCLQLSYPQTSQRLPRLSFWGFICSKWDLRVVAHQTFARSLLTFVLQH